MMSDLTLYYNVILTAFIREDFTGVQKLCEELYRIAEEKESNYHKAAARGTLGYMHYELGNYEKAIELIHEARVISTEGDNAFTDTGHLALCYSKTGDLQKSLYYTDLALTAAEQMNNDGALYEWSNFRANILFKMEEVSLALDWTMRSMDIAERIMKKPGHKFFLYQPWLTKLEILTHICISECDSNKGDDCSAHEVPVCFAEDQINVIRARLQPFFDKMKAPRLHLKRDRERFYRIQEQLRA
jgi:tetratricopeptide (TPR) repeat protein